LTSLLLYFTRRQPPVRPLAPLTSKRIVKHT
jgi:hypothetical protein